MFCKGFGGLGAQTIVCVTFGHTWLTKPYAYNGLSTHGSPNVTHTMVWAPRLPKPLQNLAKTTKISPQKTKTFQNMQKTPKTTKTSPAPKTSADVFGAGKVFEVFGVFAGLEKFLPFAERFLGFLQGFVRVLVVWVPKPLYA